MRNLLSVLILVLATASVQSVPPPIGEDVQLRDALRRRGLTDMLAQLIVEHPPKDEIEAKLAQRTLALQRAAQRGISQIQKNAQLQKAVDLLESLIRKYPADSRRFDWRLDLASDVLYKQAEPYFNAVLFRGGSDADRVRLLQLAGKAANLFQKLREELQAEHNRIQDLDPQAFGQVTASGLVERTERLLPLAGYFEQWARFYRGLALDPNAPKTQQVFADVIRYMSVDNEFTTLPHGETGVQCQALWITGTAHRLLGQYEDAMTLLIRCIQTVEKLPDESDRRALRWVAVLGRLELIKVLRDQGQFDQAIEASSAFRRWAGEHLGDNYGTLEAIALLEGTIYLHQAEQFAEQGDHERADDLRMQSRKPLIELAGSHPEHQDRLYRTVYQLMGHVADVAALDAFEKNAYISGLIGDVRRLSSKRKADRSTTKEAAEKVNVEKINAKLNEAIRVARLLVEEKSDLAEQLRPATLYNLAVCLHEKGKSVEAVEAFLELADKYAGSGRAHQAIAAACSIAYKRLGNAGPASVDASRELFIRAAETMVKQYPEGSVRWRFPLGRALEAAGRHVDAAKVYQLIPTDSPQFLDARYLQLKARRKALGLASNDRAQRKFKVAWNLVEEASRFAEQARTAHDESSDPKRRRTLDEYAVTATLLAAEIEASRIVAAPAKALKRVTALRERGELSPALLGRVLRVQIMALQSLGQLEEASKLVETYLNSDAAQAGAVVQGLIQSIRKEIVEDRQAGRQDHAKKRADEALQLAQQLNGWARRREGALISGSLPALTLLLAESYLDAEHYTEALGRFDACVDKFNADNAENRSRQSRLALGRAETLYHLKQYTESRKLFDSLWRGSPPNTEIWWRALLRTLQCHDMLKTSPEQILASIQQHRRLYPKMKYPAIKSQLDALEAALKGRLATSVR